MNTEPPVAIDSKKRKLPITSSDIAINKLLCIFQPTEIANVNYSTVKYGCGECLCIAIESHRPELMRELLSQPDIVYRDMFWSSTRWPPVLQQSRHIRPDEYFPVLHIFGPNDNRSLVSSIHYGHEPVDEELREPLLFDQHRSEYIDRFLISLPMIARWHSSADFNAEQILRDSCKFDFSEPQLFHLFHLQSPDYDEYANGISDNSVVIRGTFHQKLDEKYEPILCCSFENGHKEYRDSKSHPLLHHISPYLVIRSGRFESDKVKLDKHFGMLSSLFEQFVGGLVPYFGSDSQILKDLKIQLESGADLNCLMSKSEVIFEIRRLTKCERSIHYLSVLYIACELTEFFDQSEYSQFTHQYNDLFHFFLRHGLSVFFDFPSYRYMKPPNLKRKTLFACLFSLAERSLWPFISAIASQLLSLGYGRRELHSFKRPLFDANLGTTRNAIEKMERDDSMEVALQLRSLVQRFDSGPLTLQELSRIAIRRAVGGVDFARRVQSEELSLRLPPALFQYVSDPTELMLSDSELNRLLTKL